METEGSRVGERKIGDRGACYRDQRGLRPRRAWAALVYSPRAAGSEARNPSFNPQTPSICSNKTVDKLRTIHDTGRPTPRPRLVRVRRFRPAAAFRSFVARSIDTTIHPERLTIGPPPPRKKTVYTYLVCIYSSTSTRRFFVAIFFQEQMHPTASPLQTRFGGGQRASNRACGNILPLGHRAAASSTPAPYVDTTAQQATLQQWLQCMEEGAE